MISWSVSLWYINLFFKARSLLSSVKEMEDDRNQIEMEKLNDAGENTATVL